MNPKIQRFLELEAKKAEYKQFVEDLNKSIEDLVNEFSVNTMFQDAAGTVYKLIEPKGKFVYFDKYSYVRTKRGDEKKGDLSVKEAEEAGFTLPTSK